MEITFSREASLCREISTVVWRRWITLAAGLCEWRGGECRLIFFFLWFLDFFNGLYHFDPYSYYLLVFGGNCLHLISHVAISER
jgi:hypothetical protein